MTLSCPLHVTQGLNQVILTNSPVFFFQESLRNRDTKGCGIYVNPNSDVGVLEWFGGVSGWIKGVSRAGLKSPEFLF